MTWLPKEDFRALSEMSTSSSKVFKALKNDLATIRKIVGQYQKCPPSKFFNVLKIDLAI